MNIRLTQIDGKLPNLALMKLAYFHRQRGDSVHFSKRIERGFLEPHYDRVYGSAIFSRSAGRVVEFRTQFSDAIVGGTFNIADNTTVEKHLGIEDTELYDYSIYPNFEASIGFTQRGCRFKCGFCVVPVKEGRPRAVNTIADIWRGASYSKHIHLLDNDFFGQSRDQWEARIDEIKSGGFKVCWNQGINIRMIDDVSAAALASVGYYDDSFKTRRLYTAWDNVGHEDRFFRGVETLAKHGIHPRNIMAYMLVGYDPRETWERVFYRFNKMTALEIRPYPMPFNEQRDRLLPLGGHNERIAHRTLGEFQRWAIGRYYTVCKFEDYDVSARGRPNKEQGELALAAMTPARPRAME